VPYSARPRLSGRLRRGGESRLTLISAPAGFGKTTLLAEWLAAALTERSVAWLSLDESDSQPASSWTYLITALQAVVPGVGASALPLLQSAQAPIETVLTTVLNELGSVPDDLYLVLDDDHLVDGPDIQAGMSLLLEHLPPQTHLVVSTREDPALPWPACGRAASWSRSEPLTCASPSTKWRPTSTTSPGSTWRRATSRPWRDAPKAGSPRSSWPRCRCRDETTSPASSPLDRLSGPLCDAVTGQHGGKAMLESPDRANLFVVPLDDSRRWYRYHHLFADVLLTHLLDEHPDRVATLHRRASQGLAFWGRGTSPWPGRYWPRTGRSARRLPSPMRPGSCGAFKRPRRGSGREVSSRSWCCRRSPTTPAATSRARWRRWSAR
jgi:LuxR family transcriptional regulator, maltose regulon positive regulatory protein